MNGVALRDTIGLRLGLIALAIATLSLISVLTADRYYRAVQRDGAAAQMIGLSIRTFRESLARLGPDAGAVTLSDADDRTSLHYSASAPDGLRPWPRPWLERGIREALGEPDAAIETFIAPFSGRPLWVRFEAGGRSWWVSLALTVEARPRPSVLFIGATAGMMALGAIAGFVLVVRPLNRLRDQVARLDASGAAPVPDPHAPAEIRSVSDAFAALMDRLSRQRAEQDAALAAISHDLRSPLARLRMRLELAGDPDLREAGVRDVAAVDRVLGQFLAYVRGGTAVQGGVEAPLGDTLAGVTATYVGRPVTFTGAGGGPALPREAVERIAANLIDNALAHGAPPVAVSWRASASQADLRVTDAGPGIPPERETAARTAFSQLDPARSTSGGAGLGLAIVERLAQGLGGRLTFERGPDGFAAVVALPLRHAGAP